MFARRCEQLYASWERRFSARFERKADIVLSNNDGNVIARSAGV